MSGEVEERPSISRTDFGGRSSSLYRTIVADPPWGGAQPWRKLAAERHYPTMTPADIAALPVSEWAEDDAHLYLWVTNMKLAEAKPFDLIEAWGFRYITMLTWHKVGGERGIGPGWYFRGETEHCLFGMRGRLPIPPAKRERNVIVAPRTPHSVKPDRFYEMVERVSPGPYLELFARRRRYGWDVWGNEAPTEAASQAEMGLGA